MEFKFYLVSIEHYLNKYKRTKIIFGLADGFYLGQDEIFL